MKCDFDNIVWVRDAHSGTLLTWPTPCHGLLLHSSLDLFPLALYLGLPSSPLLPTISLLDRKHILWKREKKTWTLQLVNELTLEELFNANDITSYVQESWADWSLGDPSLQPHLAHPLALIELKHSYCGAANPWAETCCIHTRHGKCMRKKRLTDKKLIKTALIMR